MTNDMLDDDPQMCQFAVAAFGFRCKLLPAWLLLGRLTVAMPLVQPLLTAIGQARDVSFWPNAALFVQGKVMVCPVAVRRTDDLLGALIDYHLAFQCVALLLAAVVAPLSLLGTFDRCFAPIHDHRLDVAVSLLKPFLAGQSKGLALGQNRFDALHNAADGRLVQSPQTT